MAARLVQECAIRPEADIPPGIEIEPRQNVRHSRGRLMRHGGQFPRPPHDILEGETRRRAEAGAGVTAGWAGRFCCARIAGDMSSATAPVRPPRSCRLSMSSPDPCPMRAHPPGSARRQGRKRRRFQGVESCSGDFRQTVQNLIGRLNLQGRFSLAPLRIGCISPLAQFRTCLWLRAGRRKSGQEAGKSPFVDGISRRSLSPTDLADRQPEAKTGGPARSR